MTATTYTWHTLDCLDHMYPQGSGTAENVQPMSDFKMSIVQYLQSTSSQAKVLQWEKSRVEVEFDFLLPYVYMNFHFYRGLL